MSDFARGQRVRLTKDCTALHCGDEVFKKGETGTLGKMYRIQDGLEIWHMDMDQRRHNYYTFIAVTHLDIERVIDDKDTFEDDDPPNADFGEELWWEYD